MTRKDFELIAEVIRELPPHVDVDYRRLIAKAFAAKLRATNDKFIPVKFLKACGVEL